MAEILFSRRLRAWLVYRDLRPSAFARKIGVSKSLVSYWLSKDESRRKNPSYDMLPEIARGLGISIARLFGPLPR
jgi:transcriptional regulator with XRE-family HTH domain